jgi:hypothetical protein
MNPDLKFVFDFQAILSINEETGINLLAGGISQEDAQQPETYVALLVGGLRHSNPEIDRDAALKLVAGVPARVVILALVDAIKEGMGSSTDEPKTSTSPATSEG